MREKSKKSKSVELFVDSYRVKNGHPPTYSVIQKRFKLSRGAAWNRCSKFRDKMSQSRVADTSPKMTEAQFIAKFKKSGFDLYLTSEIKKKLKRLEVLENKTQ